MLQLSCRLIASYQQEEINLLIIVLIIMLENIHYRATHMHSTDYAVARCPSVCPSVHHTPVFCLNGYTYHQSSFTVL